MPSASNRSTGFYAAELDGLRCLAVGTVMIAHFSPTLSQFADWGNIGVRLFFVLSGFLITQLLLRARQRMAETGSTLGRELRQFFIRRAFRLWPVYYACLLGAYALHVSGTETNFWWHALFATNQYAFHFQRWPTLLSHFWTLAVEQQFYLVWPFVVLLFPLRRLSMVLILVMLAGPCSRELILALRLSGLHVIYTPLPCCLDFFALGAVIAWGQQAGGLAQFARRATLRILILADIGWIALGSYFKITDHMPAHWAVYDPLLQALGFAALIAYLLQNPASHAARCLRLPPLVYLGQISYGIYIFHNFMHRLGPALLRRAIGVNYFSSETLHIIYLSSLSIVVAAISYHLFENPIRRFGRRLAS